MENHLDTDLSKLLLPNEPFLWPRKERTFRRNSIDHSLPDDKRKLKIERAQLAI